VRELKRGLAPGADPLSWELHGKEIRHDHGRKRKRSPLRLKTKAKKISALGAIVSAVCDYDVTVFAVVVKKDAVRRVRGKGSMVVEYAMTFLLERLELFLRARGGKMALVVLDNMRAGDRLEVEKTFGSLAGGHSALSCAKIEHISGMEFVDSMSSNCIQAVDVIAYVLGRHMRGDEDFGGVFSQIEGKIWREGGWYGLRVFGAGAAGRPYNRGRRP